MEAKEIDLYQVLLEDTRVMRIAMDADMDYVDAAACFSALTNAFRRASSSFSWRPYTIEEEDYITGKIVKAYRLEKREGDLNCESLRLQDESGNCS